MADESENTGGLEDAEPNEKRAKKKKNWINKAIKRPGALHRALHVPQGKKIPAVKLAAATRSSNPRIRKEAQLAKTLKKLRD